MQYIFDSTKEYRTGLSLFYPLIYSIVVGLETKHAFEFGAGWSTRVILDALKETGGQLRSVSTDSQQNVMLGNGTHKGAIGDVAWLYSDYSQYWIHIHGQTPDVLNTIEIEAPLDFVLHDGSHTKDVVYNDFSFILPKMKYNSILLVHDVLHSNCGKDMRSALGRALKPFKHQKIILPYGYGLAMVVLKCNEACGVVNINRNKPSRIHITEHI